LVSSSESLHPKERDRAAKDPSHAAKYPEGPWQLPLQVFKVRNEQELVAGNELFHHKKSRDFPAFLL
jgi:hypothetical protein